MAGSTFGDQLELMPGEEILGTVICNWMRDDAPDTVYCVAEVLVTTQRIGSRNPLSPFMCPVSAVTSLYIEPTLETVQVGYGGDVSQIYHGDEVQHLYNMLLAARVRVLSPAAIAPFVVGCQHAKARQWQEAVRSFEQARSLEGFHPAVIAAHALAQKRAGEIAEAADSMLDCVQLLSNVFPDLVTFPSQFKMSGHHLHRLEALCGDVSVEDVSPFALCWRSLVASRRGNHEIADRFLRRVLSMASEKNPEGIEELVCSLMFAMTCGSPTLWPACVDGLATQSRFLREILDEAGAEESIPAVFSEHALSIWRRIASFEEDPCGSARAATDLGHFLGEPAEDAVSPRTIEDWEEAVNARSRRTPYPSDGVRNLGTDPESIKEVIDWLIVDCDLSIDAEHLWARLRMGRQAMVPGSGTEWWKRILASAPAVQVRAWIAGLVVVETLLRDGDRAQARTVLDASYQGVASMLGDRRDIYFRWASGLYGFYAALTDRDAAGVWMYSGILRQHPGFEWTHDLATLIVGDEAQRTSGRRVAISDFEQWVQSAARYLELQDNPGYRAAYRELNLARKTKRLRVVVGGETSAGKSSFVNALLGERVLFVTAEEATAVPTSVVHGEVWSAVVLGKGGDILDRIMVGANPSKDAKAKFANFVQRYSALKSVDAERVGEVRLAAPTVALPRGVELVDTPGFNAHAVRTKIAQGTIDRAHACIFVLDAGAALKSGEMSKIRWAEEAVGKTLFVINKMDRAIGDDDLDVDESAAEDLLERVSSDLAAHLNVDDVNLFAVCSLPEDKIRKMGLPEEALEYAQAVGSVHHRMMEILEGSREELVEYAAGKLARVVAEAALEESYRRLATQEERVVSLSFLLPPEPKTFDAYVLSLVHGVWEEVQSQYIQQMIAVIQAAQQRADQRFISGIQSCGDAAQLKHWVRDRVRPILNDFIGETQNARIEQWAAIGEVVSTIVADFFSKLSSQFSGSMDLDLDALFRQSTPMPLPQPGGSLEALIAEWADAKMVATGGGAVAGAFLGTLLLPGVGTAIGGWLGGVAGSATAVDPSQKLYERLHEELGRVSEQVCAALDADMTGTITEPAPVLRGLESGLRAARMEFSRRLDREMQLAARDRDAVFREGVQLRKLASEAWAHAQGFQH